MINPTFEQRAESRLDLIVAGSDEAIVMVEAGAKEVSEDAVELDLLDHHLRRWIEGAHPYLTIVEGARGPMGFEGGPSRLRFVAAEDGRGDRAGDGVTARSGARPARRASPGMPSITDFT